MCERNCNALLPCANPHISMEVFLLLFLEKEVLADFFRRLWTIRYFLVVFHSSKDGIASPVNVCLRLVEKAVKENTGWKW